MLFSDRNMYTVICYWSPGETWRGRLSAGHSVSLDQEVTTWFLKQTTLVISHTKNNVSDWQCRLLFLNSYIQKRSVYAFTRT